MECSLSPSDLLEATDKPLEVEASDMSELSTEAADEALDMSETSNISEPSQKLNSSLVGIHESSGNTNQEGSPTDKGASGKALASIDLSSEIERSKDEEFVVSGSKDSDDDAEGNVFSYIVNLKLNSLPKEKATLLIALQES